MLGYGLMEILKKQRLLKRTL